MEFSRENPFYEPWATGRMAARYMPADPEAWFAAAHAADLHVSVHGECLHFAEGDISEDAIVFFKSWLSETPGGRQALMRFLRGRGLTERQYPM
jgi:hypothetical protein